MKYEYKAYRKTILHNGKYYSQYDLDRMATQLTNIKPNKGSSNTQKAIKGLTQNKRYNNKQAQQRHSYNPNEKALKKQSIST